MKPLLRKITVSIFVLLFLILAPLLTAYSLGYRYDFKTGNLQKNGAFYIKSYPKGADIYIDSIKKRPKTPTQIVNVVPGAHKVEVVKNNYVPWVKNLEIHSGETTFAEDIVLFLADRQKTDLGVGSEQMLLNNAKDKYATLDKDNNLLITDISQAITFNIDVLDTNYNLVDFSDDNQNILLEKDKKYFSFNVDQKQLEAIPVDNVQKMLWEDNSNTLIYLKDNKLYRRQHRSALLSSGDPDQLLDIREYINDFDILGSWLIIHYTFDKNNYVKQLDKHTLELRQTVNNVNIANLETLVADNDYLIFTLGTKLYIQNSFKDLITIPITIVTLHDDRLLFTNGHEIILFNFKEDWQTLIDRSSNIVSDILWHPNGSYFISEIDDRTILTEIDGRDRRNSIELLNYPRKKSYVFDKKGEKLFIVTPEENYYLSIQ